MIRQDANRQLQQFVSSILQLLQEIDRCNGTPLDRETGSIRHMHQVLNFIEGSPHFSQSEVNDIRNLARELELIKDLFERFASFHS